MVKPNFTLLFFFSFITIGIGEVHEGTSAQIISVTQEGVGYVTDETLQGGVHSFIGRWDTPFPNGLKGPEAPGLQPEGYSTLVIGVEVNDGGDLSFDLLYQTYDTGKWDWVECQVIASDGITTLISPQGRPGNEYGILWESPNISIFQPLDKWKHQNITVKISVRQDGWGDQTQAEVMNLSVSGCLIRPLTTLTDPDSIRFENAKEPIDVERLTPEMRIALYSFKRKVLAAGGTFKLRSAYRPSQYQNHLQEVWDKFKLLQFGSGCKPLKKIVDAEFKNHAPVRRPGGPNSNHCKGLAFDVNIDRLSSSETDRLANEVGLHRPEPRTDPVHYEFKMRN